MRLLAFTVGMLASIGAAVAPAAEPSLAETEARLAAMNTLARGHYAEAKRAALAVLGPVIVVTADELLLRHAGATERVAYLPARYAHLKALGHVPLGLWSLLATRLDRPVDRPALAAYREHVAALQPLVGALGLRWDDARRQREILATTLAFIDAVAARGAVTAGELAAYADDIGPALLGNAYDAAEVQLAALHDVVQRWRAALPAADWARLHVVVLGPNRPREAQPAHLYFRRLLGDEAAASRLVAADNSADIDAALDLLAAAALDRRVSGAFFADPGRLGRGLLSDATARHLDRLLGP